LVDEAAGIGQPDHRQAGQHKGSPHGRWSPTESFPWNGRHDRARSATPTTDRRSIRPSLIHTIRDSVGIGCTNQRT
jgi:hypothetical protein